MQIYNQKIRTEFLKNLFFLYEDFSISDFFAYLLYLFIFSLIMKFKKKKEN